MAIILRTVKGSELTFAEVDGNFQSLFYSSSFDGTNLVLYTTGSTSQSIDLSTLTVDTGSLMVTGSILNGTLTFTKGDGSTFDLVYNTGSFTGSFTGDGSGLTGIAADTATTASYVETAQTASYVLGLNVNGPVADAVNAVSSSYASTASYVENAQTASYVENAQTASYVTTAQTASYVDLVAGDNIIINQVGTSFEISGSVSAVDTGSLLTTASAEFAEITFTKGDGSTFLVDSTPRQVIETVKNLESGTLVKGTPVYASGSTGNAVHVYAASASLSSRMPAAYILNQDLTSGQEGEGLLIGFINGVDTSAFASGDVVYVAADGGYTNVKPTGSNLIQNLGKVIISDAVNGSGVISGAGRSNDVPNILEGYVWIGDSNGVATPSATSSIQNVVSSSYALTSSHAQSGDGTFSGSFSGSFEGDGSGLTNLPVTSYWETGSGEFSIKDVNSSSTIATAVSFSIVAGGTNHSISSGNRNAIVGGFNHSIISGASNGIVGGRDGVIDESSNNNFIGGGDDNKISGSAVRSAHLAGNNNLISGSTNSSTMASENSTLIDNQQSSILASNTSEIIVSQRASIVSAGNSSISSSNEGVIIGGQINNINNSIQSTILGGNNNTISSDFVTTSQVSILGGNNNTISESLQSSIISSVRSLIQDLTGSAIIGGQDITASADNTVYVPNLVATGSVTGSSFTGSFVGDGSGLTGITVAATASYVDLVAGPNVTINQVGTSFEISSSGGGGSAFPFTGDAEITGSLTIKGDGNTSATTNFTLKNSDDNVLLEVGEDSTNYVEFNDGYFQMAPASTSNTLGGFSNQSVYLGTGITAAGGGGSVNRVYAQGQNHTLAATANLNDSFILGTTHTIAQGNRSFVLGESINMGELNNSFVGGNTINGSTAELDGSFIWNASTSTMILNDTSSGLILLGKSTSGFDGDNIVGIGGDHYSTLTTLSQHYAFGDRIRGTVSRQTVIGMGTDSGTMLQLASGAANGVHLGVASNRPGFGLVKPFDASLTTTAQTRTGLVYLGTGLPVALNVTSSGDGVFWIENVDAIPTANITNAGALYNNSGKPTWWDGTTSYDLTATGSGGGSSLWTDNSNRLTNDTYAITELNNSTANTYNGSYLVGNLTVGNGNTYTNGSARTVIVGLNNNISTISQADTLIAVGNGNTIRGGLYNLIVGANHILEGDKNTNSGDNNDIYGDENVILGADNVIGQVATPANNSVAIGNSNTIHGSNQLVFGSSNNLTFNNTEQIPGIFFGLGYGSMPNAGFWTDPTYAAGAQPINFSFGTQNAAREGSTIKSGSGAGIFYLNNSTNQVIEPSVAITDSVALWAKDRGSGQIGLAVRSENQITSFIGDRIGVNNTSPSASLHVVGEGSTSATTALLIEDSGSVNELFRIKDDGTISGSVFSGSFVGDGSGLTGISGGSLWTNDGSGQISYSATAAAVQIYETGFANSYGSAVTLRRGIFVVGEANTIGDNVTATTVGRTAVFGGDHTVGNIGGAEYAFTAGYNNTIEEGLYNIAIGNDNEIKNTTDSGISIGTNNILLGTKSIIIGDNNETQSPNAIIIGQSVRAGDGSKNQVALGQNFDVSHPFYNDGFYVDFSSAIGNRPTFALTKATGLAANVPLNMALGSDQGGRNDGTLGAGSTGAGSGVFWHFARSTTEPTVNLTDAVALYVKDRTGASGKAGYMIKAEDGTQHFFSDFSAIGGDETKATANKILTIVGGGTTSGTSALVVEDDSDNTLFEVKDDGTIHGVPGAILAMTELTAAALVTHTVTTSTTATVINLNSDATTRLAKASFVAPPSGNVLVRIEFDAILTNSATNLRIGLHNANASTTTPTEGWFRVNGDQDGSSASYFAEFKITGLTPGTTYDRYFVASSDFSGVTIRASQQQTGAIAVSDLPSPLRIKTYDLGAISITSNPTS